ncbi:MAG: hypothetical protein A2275_17870 [Bacteroidetes bacterium RIFOXYA12_FULL_35_11]|nr:MAG: hypothetical protein A2X01_19030 [Bacteroidetes bacterium GWF2_35_48]OFY74890.1 MAG: hypothetical protein A2275_17870 [Bacteroidetes bacterium RIFOXYA12_FULL_35_11]HBX49578.1 hypothetical protein [Bacteroidales bacterium]
MKNLFLFYCIFIIFPFSSFSDNTDTTRIVAFQLNHLQNIDTIPIDTSLNNFQIFNYSYLISKSISTLGNNGSPFISNDFFDRNLNNYPAFLNAFSPWFFNNHNIFYVNTRSPYTDIFYSFGSQKDQILKIFHSQNINKKFNLGLNYRLEAAPGYFKRQRTRNHAIAVFSSYYSERYILNAHFVFNLNQNLMNGGIANDSLFERTDEPTQTIPVNFTNAVSNASEKSFFMNQKFLFFKLSDADSIRKKYLFNLGHTSAFTVFSRAYNDDKSNFYQNWFYDSLKTKDTAFQKSLDNYVFLGINPYLSNKFPLDVKFGVNSRIEKNGFYSYDTTFASLGFAGSIAMNNPLFDFSLTAKSFIQGHYSGNKSVDVIFNKYLFSKNDSNYISIKAAYNIAKPDFFEEKYFSNNFRWDTVFLNRKNLLGGISYNNLKRNIVAGVNFQASENYIYYDSLALPTQLTEQVTIFSAFIKANLKFGKFHLNNSITYQLASNSVIPLPDLIFFHSAFFKFNFFKAKLPTHIGFDVYYNSYYKGYAYMPATSVFYLQYQKKMGGHPYIDFFIAAQRKKARLFFKLEHLSALMSKRNYYTVLNYPMNGFTMKFGVSWRFSD